MASAELQAANGFRTFEFEVLNTERRESGEIALSLFIGAGRPPMILVVAEGFEPICNGDFITLLCPVRKVA